jgi:hypothetical protein
MLLHQGAAAFTLWTGKPAPLELMQKKLHEARAAGLRSAEGEPAGDDGTGADGKGADGKGADGSGGAGAGGAAAEGEPSGAAASD